MTIKAKYTGDRDGEHRFYEGVPARDLTDEEYAELSDDQRRLVDSGAIYDTAPPPKADTRRQKVR